jgi:predicted amidohydrolase YtcJ
MARKRLGDRNIDSYRWKSLLNRGIKIMGGSDFPIESYDPLIGINAFVNRIPFNETESWYPHESLSLNEAISSYTQTENSDLSYLKPGSDINITILESSLTGNNTPNVLATYC